MVGECGQRLRCWPGGGEGSGAEDRLQPQAVGFTASWGRPALGGGGRGGPRLILLARRGARGCTPLLGATVVALVPPHGVQRLHPVALVPTHGVQRLHPVVQSLFERLQRSGHQGCQSVTPG